MSDNTDLARLSETGAADRNGGDVEGAVATHHESAQTMAHAGSAVGVSDRPADRLGRAAPQLLEALRIAEVALNNIRVCCRHTAWDRTGPAVIAARAAIAAATEAQP